MIRGGDGEGTKKVFEQVKLRASHNES